MQRLLLVGKGSRWIANQTTNSRAEILPEELATNIVAQFHRGVGRDVAPRPAWPPFRL